VISPASGIIAPALVDGNSGRNTPYPPVLAGHPSGDPQLKRKISGSALL
jgi:hypothetical protein